MAAAKPRPRKSSSNRRSDAHVSESTSAWTRYFRSRPFAWMIAATLSAFGLLLYLRSQESDRSAADLTASAVTEKSFEPSPVKEKSADSNPTKPEPLTAATSHSTPVSSTASALSCVPGLSDRTTFAPMADLFAKTSPSSDPDWQSEQVSELTSKQLQAIAQLTEATDEGAEEQLNALVSPKYRSQLVRPKLREVFRDATLAVFRQEGPASGELSGRKELLKDLRELVSIYAHPPESHLHFKFKIVRTEMATNRIVTTAFVEIYGPSVSFKTRLAEQTAVWECTWVRAEGGDAALLENIVVRDMEEVVPASDRPGTFLDCTEALLGQNASYRDQLAYGTDHWYGNMDVAFGIRQGNQGLALGDVNGDGREDLFVCQPAGVPCRMYFQEPDGTLKDVTSETGMDWLDASRSALFADFDNDGDQDMVASLNYSIVFFENLGGGKFFMRSRVDVHSWPSSLATADYDNDGDLDLYICGYTPRGAVAAGDIFANPVPYHDANNGAPNFMIQNNGNWDFLDVTQQVGLDQNNRKFSFAAAWEDYDNDGDQDLYVANDFGRNNLYRNDRDATGSCHFVDVAEEAGVVDIAAGMSVSWGDYNHDGWMDLYVANMFSSAGSRITTQSQFKSADDETTRQSMQRHARGNSLFLNQQDGTFSDVSVNAGVTLGRWAWSSLFTDINNDGWEDIYVTNGFSTTPDTGDL